MLLYDFKGGAAFEDDFAPVIQAGPAGLILHSMREHFAAWQLANQLYQERNDPKFLEARRAEKRTARMLRHARRQEFYSQYFSSQRPVASEEKK